MSEETGPRRMRHAEEVTTGASAALAMPANGARCALIVQETAGTNSIRFGGPDISATKGVFVPAGGTVTLTVECPTSAIWVHQDSGAGIAAVTEIVGG